VKIDAHQHFWHYSAAEYGWIGPGMELLQKDHLPADLAPPL
jgi:L-fuconolactonase